MVKNIYNDRDLSWLSFNKRILMEAANPEVPLYERIKFLAIYSSNLDEFFRVRVAALRSIVNINKKKINKRFNHKPSKTLDAVLAEVNKQQQEFGRIKRNEIVPALKSNNIILYRDEEILPDHQKFINHYFKSKVLSYLQPQILNADSEKRPFLENKLIYFALDLIDVNGDRQYALLNIPSDFLPRYIELPKIGKLYYYITLDDIVKENLNFLFASYQIKGCYSVKLNRDAELNIDDEYSGDLVKKIKKQITKRNIGVPSRFLYDHTMPDKILIFLKDLFELEPDEIVPGGRYHNMNDLFQLGNPLSPKLENDYLEPLPKRILENQTSIFDAIDQGDVLLHFPYQTYDYVLRFFNEAALDPFVKEIKATFYRIAPESFICNALISAANNGKQVTVFVEIKARFDEQNNLKWAERMEEAGIRIIYSIPGLKVHAKVALVIRSKEEGEISQYGYFGTGNFNEKTATIYADQALFTKHLEMTTELNSLFDYLCDHNQVPTFNRLMVSQFNIIEKFVELIDREIYHVKQGKEGHIIIKLNNLQDNAMIDKLYEASNAGVKIELIVRAICCIKPGVEGQSENITVHRIVDGFLEHSRAFWFYNNGVEELYQGSADWMKRNLYRRIEVVFPVLDEKLRDEVKQMLNFQLHDNIKGVLLDKDLVNQHFETQNPVRSQVAFYKWLAERELK